MKRFAFILVLVLAAAPVSGQRAEGKGQGKWQGTSKEERQRMREDMRAYKGAESKVADSNKAAPRQGQRQMSPEQREGLRRDMQDANRNLKKR
jgi:hypothetical protein